MKKSNTIYKIASLKIRFDYAFDDFFYETLKNYEINSEEYDCYMRTHVVEEISELKTEPITMKHNRFIYFENNCEHIVVKDESHKIEMMVSYDLEYKNIDLYLRKDMNNIEEKEYVFSGIMFMDFALSKGYLSIHASGIDYQGEGILFSAPSKTGKSTHARYWLETESDSYIFNDDKPLIKIEDNIVVYGTPWCGKTLINRNVKLPLKTIVFLSQGKENTIKELSNQEKLVYLMRNINRPRQKHLWDKSIEILNHLITIPMYHAHVTNHIDSVSVVQNKINGVKQ